MWSMCEYICICICICYLFALSSQEVVVFPCGQTSQTRHWGQLARRLVCGLIIGEGHTSARHTRPPARACTNNCRLRLRRRAALRFGMGVA